MKMPNPMVGGGGMALHVCEQNIIENCSVNSKIYDAVDGVKAAVWLNFCKAKGRFNVFRTGPMRVR